MSHKLNYRNISTSVYLYLKITALPDPHLCHNKPSHMSLSVEPGCYTEPVNKLSYKPTETAVVAGRFMLHLQNLDYLGQITYDLLTIMSLANSSFSIQIQWACLLHSLRFTPVSHIHTSTDHSCLLFKLKTPNLFQKWGKNILKWKTVYSMWSTPLSLV